MTDAGRLAMRSIGGGGGGQYQDFGGASIGGFNGGGGASYGGQQSYGGGYQDTGFGAGSQYGGSPSRVGQAIILDSHVVSRKMAKFDPQDGHIDEEVEMDLDGTGRVRRATLKSNTGNVGTQDFFQR